MKPAIIVGLGNPGKAYNDTRHNIGFDLIDAMAPPSAFRKEKKFLYARAGSVILSKPLTYMNLSGEAVSSLLVRFRCPSQRMLVVCDDFSLRLGRIRLRLSGSAGGHNGLKSIISAIGDDFPRLKLGVGPLPEGVDAADFVLRKFSRHEMVARDKIVEKAAEIVNEFISNGFAGSASWSVVISET